MTPEEVHLIWIAVNHARSVVLQELRWVSSTELTEPPLGDSQEFLQDGYLQTVRYDPDDMPVDLIPVGFLIPVDECISYGSPLPLCNPHI